MTSPSVRIRAVGRITGWVEDPPGTRTSKVPTASRSGVVGTASPRCTSISPTEDASPTHPGRSKAFASSWDRGRLTRDEGVAVLHYRCVLEQAGHWGRRWLERWQPATRHAG